MTTNPNRCPVCRAAISHEHLMCGRHWMLVPLPLRNQVLSLYRYERGSEAHRKACFAAVRAVVEIHRSSR